MRAWVGIVTLVCGGVAFADRPLGSLIDEAAEEARELAREDPIARVHEQRLEHLLDDAADELNRLPAAPDAVHQALRRAWEELARYRLAQRNADPQTAASANEELMH